MSLKDPFPKEIPKATEQVVEPLLAASSVYQFIGLHGDEIINDADFEDMYSEEGRPGINPVILAFVTVFQFLERLSDRRAALMASMRLDWKYALRQPLTWTGFDHTDLCNFRKRLLKNEQEMFVFDKVVVYLREHGHIRSKGKQRTDSTHILGNVMRLSRLELVWETIRLAVSALISTNARWSLHHIPSTFVEEHTSRRSDYRLSDSKVKSEMTQAGSDGYWLLKRIEEHGKDYLELPEVQTLKRVLNEQFIHKDDGKPPKTRKDGDCSGDVIETPHDTDVRYGKKGSRNWRGYKLQVTETVDTPRRFITDIMVTSTLETDNQALDDIQQRLVKRKVLPASQYGDQGYVNGGTIERSHKQYGIDLRGYVSVSNSHKTEGFRLMDFDINIKEQYAICPAGRKSVRWKQAKPNRKLVAFRVGFGTACRECPFFAEGFCTTHKRGRTLGVNPYHDILQARREEMQTEQFAKEMHQRSAIEGTISEVIRAHDARRSRYRGLAKNQLQAYFVGAATNLKRLTKAASSLLLAQIWTFVRLLDDIFLNMGRVFQQNPTGTLRSPLV